MRLHHCDQVHPGLARGLVEIRNGGPVELEPVVIINPAQHLGIQAAGHPALELLQAAGGIPLGDIHGPGLHPRPDQLRDGISAAE